jgi:hypothetical protein
MFIVRVFSFRCYFNDNRFFVSADETRTRTIANEFNNLKFILNSERSNLLVLK